MLNQAHHDWKKEVQSLRQSLDDEVRAKNAALASVEVHNNWIAQWKGIAFGLQDKFEGGSSGLATASVDGLQNHPTFMKYYRESSNK